MTNRFMQQGIIAAALVVLSASAAASESCRKSAREEISNAMNAVVDSRNHSGYEFRQYLGSTAASALHRAKVKAEICGCEDTASTLENAANGVLVASQIPITGQAYSVVVLVADAIMLSAHEMRKCTGN